jgi:hypothetical protein
LMLSMYFSVINILWLIFSQKQFIINVFIPLFLFVLFQNFSCQNHFLGCKILFFTCMIKLSYPLILYYYISVSFSNKF